MNVHNLFLFTFWITTPYYFESVNTGQFMSHRVQRYETESLMKLKSCVFKILK